MKNTLKRSYVRVLLASVVLAMFGMVVWLWPDLVSFTFYEPYLPHGFCFMWNKHLVVLHVVSDALIGLSYLTISVLLTIIVHQNRKLIPFGWMFLAFGAFIVACGVTHFMEILVLWRPFYWLEGETKLFTAAVSLFTACMLPPLTPRIHKLLVDADVSAKAQEQREQAYRFTRSIIESSAFTIIVTDLDGNITAVNPAAERLLWFRPEELVHKQNILQMYDPQELASKVEKRAAEFHQPIVRTLDALTIKARNGLIDEGEWTFIRKDDAKVPVHVTVTSLTGASEEDGYMFTAFDITERLRSQEYIRHVATHDALTGLPSRILFRDRLEQALNRAVRFGERVAVLMVDLDNFKRINDSLGHHAGDEALIVIAQRLRESVRKTDTVARMGGDEFMVILCDIQEKMVDTMAKQILHALAAPVQLGSHEVYITASIGICSDPADDDPVAVLKQADLALYKSKAEGKNQIHHYTRDMAYATVERLQMEASLRSSVLRNELELVFQPQISLETKEMTGMEALVRWPRGDNEDPVMPGQFIPLAEETGLIVPIGEWVLNRACQDGANLIKELDREIVVAVNMSARQFKDSGVFQSVVTALETSGLPAHCLELEITESMLMRGAQETMDTLTRIRNLGVRVAIDDFGTGFSSMSYITRFSIDRIKIDQSFVRGVLTDANCRAVITAIVAMAHGLGISVIAEGTETPEQAAALIELQCDEAQGYLYSRPVDIDQIPSIAQSMQST